jgi:hypothetical protein
LGGASTRAQPATFCCMQQRWHMFNVKSLIIIIKLIVFMFYS